MIEEDYVSFETAKLLKEKGFNEPCLSLYRWSHNDNRYIVSVEFPPLSNEWLENEEKEDELVKEGYVTKDDLERLHIIDISAPTLQMAMKWLRERRIFIDIFHYNSKFAPFVWMIFAYNRTSPQRAETYEEAAEAAIKYILENWDDVNSVLDEYYKVDEKLPII